VLGEYPSVISGDMATRNRSAYAPRSQVGQEARTVFEEEFIRAGGDQQVASRATVDRLVASGAPRQNAQDAVTRLLNRRVTDQELQATAEAGTQGLIDNVANAGTLASSTGVRAAITQRAATLGQRLLERIRAMSPGGKTIRDAEDMLANVLRSARSDYDAVYNAPGGRGPNGQPVVNQGVLYGGLNAVVRRTLNRMRNMGGDQLAALREAIDPFYIAPHQGAAGRATAQSEQSVLSARLAIPMLREDLAVARRALAEARRQRAGRDVINQMARNVEDTIERLRLSVRDAQINNDRTLTTSLEAAQNARSAIRGKIQEARRRGRDDLAAILQPLYDDVTRVMERASPLWARANRNWADMRLEEVAADLGTAFSERAGPALRAQLREFAQLAPEAQNIVRVHFVQKLLDQVEHEIRLQGQTNLGKLFDRQDKRNLTRAILGDEAANTLVRAVRDANIMQQTLGRMRDTRTHIRGQIQREVDADLTAIAAASQFDWRNWRAAALEHVLSVIRERRNRVLGRALTTPMRDVPVVAEQIERMRRATERLGVANNARGYPMAARAGIWAPAINPTMADYLQNEGR
jgi:hypothetical protein